MEKKIIVIGGIGETDRENRDAKRVIFGKGIIYTIKAHSDKDQPLVVKKWRRKSKSKA